MDFKRFWANIFLFAVMFYLALYSAWYISYSNDFYYPFIYYGAKVDENVLNSENKLPKTEEFFTYTSPSEHFRLFHALMQSVENDGKGLKDIKYEYNNLDYPFLTSAEVSQIGDAAAAFSFFKSFLRLFILLGLGGSIYLIVSREEPYRWDVFTRGMSVVYAVCIFVVWLVGLDKFMGLMGTLIFPYRNDWFFYNPLSLPSLIMPYPVTFTTFFMVMSVTTLALWALYYKICTWFIRLIIYKSPH